MLRADGASFSEIARQVPVSKSTLSLWLRDIALTEEQHARLSQKTDREKFSRTMRLRREERIRALNAVADAEFESMRQRTEFWFGLALYIGEGKKTVVGKIALTNCDDRVLCHTIRFFELIGIPKQRIRCSIQLHPGIDDAPVLAFWRERLGLDATQFTPVYRKVSRSSLGRSGHKQPNGTCEIYACSTTLWYKLMRWMDVALDS